ncbi:MAG: hypothetical protein H8E42_05410 [Nitrospinae bacterium]|nr:hypothetical protein [Nitrospinota bacterium]MBL7021118.1 hypothetical protein [Nitrospinaceae bacterium]
MSVKIGEKGSYKLKQIGIPLALEYLKNIAKEINCSITYLDNILWLFCADGYGEIFGSKPNCNVCELTSDCSYEK